MVLGDKRFGHLLDRVIQLKRLLHIIWKIVQGIHQLLNVFGRHRASATQHCGQHKQTYQLGSKRLGRRNANLDTRTSQKNQVALSYQRTVIHIGNHQAAKEFPGGNVAHSCKRVRGFSGLRYSDQQGVFMLDSFAVTKFRGHFDLTGNTSQLLQPVARHHSSMKTGSAGDNLYRLNLVKNCRCAIAKHLVGYLVIGTQVECGCQCPRLLIDFLDHVVIEITHICGFHRGVNTGFLALDFLTRFVINSDRRGGQECQIALFQIDKAIGHLAQGHLV